jgi:hypothetical protein
LLYCVERSRAALRAAEERMNGALAEHEASSLAAVKLDLAVAALRMSNAELQVRKAP